MYQSTFSDHLESINAAPMTIRNYMIAVAQLGAFLCGQGMPAEPTAVTREQLVEWMRFLRRPKDEDGQGAGRADGPPALPRRQPPLRLARRYRRACQFACAGTDFESRRGQAIVFVLLFIDTGIRIAEMAGIRLDNIGIEERNLVVMGKRRRPRSIRFVKETRLDIQRYILKRGHQTCPRRRVARQRRQRDRPHAPHGLALAHDAAALRQTDATNALRLSYA